MQYVVWQNHRTPNQYSFFLSQPFTSKHKMGNVQEEAQELTVCHHSLWVVWVCVQTEAAPADHGCEHQDKGSVPGIQSPTWLHQTTTERTTARVCVCEFGWSVNIANRNSRLNSPHQFSWCKLIQTGSPRPSTWSAYGQWRSDDNNHRFSWTGQNQPRTPWGHPPACGWKAAFQKMHLHHQRRYASAPWSQTKWQNESSD